MGFLDNSGDIILDAVLTDAGRARLARGDATFNIAKFALADDEIDYGLYNKTHLSGNQYYDLEILQTPVLEAFTNNTSTMNSKLVTIANNSQYYMPVVKLMQTGDWGFHPSTSAYIVAVNDDTVRYIKNDLPNPGPVTPMGVGILNGYQPNDPGDALGIRADQGIDNAARPPTVPGGLPIELEESEYYLLMDHRLGSPRLHNGTAAQNYSYLDDDNIASYLLTLNDGYVMPITSTSAGGSPIAGERGNKVHFRIQASTTLQNSQDLFERIGTQVAGTSDITSGGQNLTHYWYIDSTIRLIGITTGYRIDIPVRYVRRYTP